MNELYKVDPKLSSVEIPVVTRARVNLLPNEMSSLPWGMEDGVPFVEIPERWLRAAGYVPAALLTQERETSRRLQAALNRIVGFVSAEQAGWAIYDAEVNQ